ncbi:MAG: leucine--tRNA ligase [Nanoarchaeota archaeon]|nr:leucine--tRNA ligase [Nanoarchaeota archaeon]
MEDEINFSVIEKKWQEKWEKEKCFEVKESKNMENKKFSKSSAKEVSLQTKKKCYVLEMFPYPSGSGLHMGHAFNYSIGDIYARYKRMKGFNVLYHMGFDSFGLPAENAAIKAGEHPKKYTANAISNYIKQLKNLGLSYDWSRKVVTCDPEYYKWNQFFFLKLFEKGLIYKKKSAVNFCNKCDSVLANEQVHGGMCWRHETNPVEIRHLEQWFIKTTKYADELLEFLPKLNWPNRIKAMQENWIGKSHGTEIEFEIIKTESFGDDQKLQKNKKISDINNKKWKIFTTRPDTIYGVTFMVVSAQHSELMQLVTKEQKSKVEEFLKKLKSVSEKELEAMEKDGVFTGSYAINPLTKDKIPVYAGNFVVADYGSGMVMAVPAHDQRDFEFAKKYNIPIKVTIENTNKIIAIEKSLRLEFYNNVRKFAKVDIKDGLVNIYTDKVNEVFELAKNNFIGAQWYIHSEGNIKKIMFHSDKENKIFDWNSEKEIKEAKDYGRKLKIKEEQLDFNELRGAYTGSGILINSGEFNGLSSEKAIEEITKLLEKKKLGKKVIQYKLRDWLVSRQRYWGTPIPMIYCAKCGIVPVPEKDLPILLPENIKFGKGNPLESSEEFVNVKCPKCKGKAKRETDTMDTFFDSSWYYLRYCDSKNQKMPFDKKKVNYWMPVDQYVGGAEHACMHLIYARFFTKALRDMGFVKIDEPFTRLFNQGMLHGSDGNKMSKSLGNVVLPETVSEKYGIDTARLFLVSSASPDSDINWNVEGIEGSLKFIKKIFNYVSDAKFGKSGIIFESKINKAIKEISSDIENFKYNIAVIKLRGLFESIEKEKQIAKKDFENFLKLLAPFCPHITEEMWHNLGNKNFISLEKWPVADEKKINEKLEKQEESAEKLAGDINNILKIVKSKGQDAKKAYVYVIPNEKQVFLDYLDDIKKRIEVDIEVFAVNDKNKYDPKNIAGKTKPGKPGIYLE